MQEGRERRSELPHVNDDLNVSNGELVNDISWVWRYILSPVRCLLPFFRPRFAY